MYRQTPHPRTSETTPTLRFEVPPQKREPTNFGERLIRLRKARGLTQVQLADAMGSTQRAISYYENHASYPPAPALVALAKALRVTTDEILGLKPPKPDPREKDPELRRMWKRFQQVTELPERDQRA